MEPSGKCLVCQDNVGDTMLKCGHGFCTPCLKARITCLKDAKELRPERLICMQQGCKEQLGQAVIVKAVGPQLGMILNFVVKKYRQSKDPSNVIFNCQGFLSQQRKSLVEKTAAMSREEHSRLVLPVLHQLKKQEPMPNNVVECSSIMTLNKLKEGKGGSILCYLCGASYCHKCFNLLHEGACPEIKLPEITRQPEDFEQFLKANQILICLNPRCGLPIDKEAGCFFVKCRCQWEMCYPCKVKWGDCEHFSKYPYQKFVPMPQWMEKALNKL